MLLTNQKVVAPINLLIEKYEIKFMAIEINHEIIEIILLLMIEQLVVEEEL